MNRQTDTCVTHPAPRERHPSIGELARSAAAASAPFVDAPAGTGGTR